MAISLRLGWWKDPSATPNSVILPHRSPDSGCFALCNTCVVFWCITHAIHIPVIHVYTPVSYI